MQQPAVYLSDLCLLRDLFSPESRLVVIDPDSILTGINHHNFDFYEENISYQNCFYVNLSEFSKQGIYIGKLLNDTTEELAYINNPDGTMRWIFPSRNSSNSFLSLYNSESLKAKVYTAISSIVCKLGKSKLLASGIIRVQQNLVNQVKTKYDISSTEVISFFTGTRGETRKIVMAIHSKNETIAFTKISLNETSHNLIINEIAMLKELNRYDFTTLSLPTISKKIQGHFRLSNIKPGVTIPIDRITVIHIRALAELYAISHDRKAISDSIAWKTISENMEFLKNDLIFNNGLDPKKINKLVKLLKKLYNHLPAGESIPLSVSHGDFTPWNMYCDEQRLYVYDWEMASNGIPMLFDLFHFTFQSTILQRRKKYSSVKESISLWKQQPLIQQLVQKYRLNLLLHEQLYLLFTVSHYVRQYIAEKELLMQSHWMIDCWTEAIEDIMETTKNPT